MFVSRQNDLRLPLKKADFLALLQNVFSINLPMLEVYSSNWYQTVLVKLAVSNMTNIDATAFIKRLLEKCYQCCRHKMCSKAKCVGTLMGSFIFFQSVQNKYRVKKIYFSSWTTKISPALWGSFVHIVTKLRIHHLQHSLNEREVYDTADPSNIRSNIDLVMITVINCELCETSSCLVVYGISREI